MLSHSEDANEDSSSRAETSRKPYVRTNTCASRLKSASEHYTHQAMEIMVSSDPSIIDTFMLEHVAVVQQERFYGCLSLPFTLAFFLAFALSANLHEDITNVFLIESGLRGQIGKGLGAVEDVPQTWNWINTSLVPTLFKQIDVNGRTFPSKTKWSRVLQYNQLQGPVLLEQLRSEKTPCDGIASHMVCYPVQSQSKLQFGRNRSFTVQQPQAGEYAGGTVTLAQREAHYASGFSSSSGRQLRNMRPEVMNRLIFDGGDTFKVHLFGNTPQHLIAEHIRYLYDKGWLDQQTKQLTIKALLLNAELGRPRLEQIHVVMTFPRGGGVFTRLTLESVFLTMWSSMWSKLWDLVFILMLLFTTVLEVTRLVRANRKGELKLMLQKFPIVLQWGIIICGWMLVCLFLWQIQLTSNLRQQFKRLVPLQAQDLPADVNHTDAQFLKSAEALVLFNTWWRILIAEYHLVLMLRFFIAFRAQPRLGVVTSALEACFVDIVHFLIVLLPTFFSYAVSGFLLYGRLLEEFASLRAATGTCFKMLFEGEYDWPRLSERHYWTAALWTWSFMLVLMMLMLNMVLAIVLDVYSEMRRRAGHSESLLATLQRSFDRIRYHKQWVSNHDIALALQGAPRFLTFSEMQGSIPDMCDAQSYALLAACQQQAQSDTTARMTWTESMKMMMAIHFDLDELNAGVERLHAGPQAMVPPLNLKFASPKENRGWLQELSEKMAIQNHWMLSLQWLLQQLQWQWTVMDAVYGPGGQIPKRIECNTGSKESGPL